MKLKEMGFIQLPLFFATVAIGTLLTSGPLVVAHLIQNPPQVQASRKNTPREALLPLSNYPSLPPKIKTEQVVGEAVVTAEASPSPSINATPQASATAEPTTSPEPQASPQASPTPEPTPVVATILDIKDPITYEIDVDGKTETVRLIGLQLPTQSCEIETAFVSKNDTVFMVADPMQPDRDPGGNLYRYIYMYDESMLNEKLISEGLVQTYNFLSSPYLYESEFTKLQTQTQEKKRGFWGDTCSQETETPSSTPASSPHALTSLLDQEISKDEKTKLSENTSKTIKELKKTTSKKKYPLRLTLASLVSQPATPGASLDSELIFNLINKHRESIGKPLFTKDDRICAVAQARTPELFDEIFVTHTMHAGFYKRNLPYWATENLAHFNSEAIIVNWWLNSPVHRAAIEGDYTNSCGACLGNSCSQIFTSFVAK